MQPLSFEEQLEIEKYYLKLLLLRLQGSVYGTWVTVYQDKLRCTPYTSVL